MLGQKVSLAEQGSDIYNKDHPYQGEVNFTITQTFKLTSRSHV